jgi:hypothetical protein
MAKALQCPSCGTKRMIDTLGGIESFDCATCGKVLKVPPDVAAQAPRANAAPAPSPAAAPSPVPAAAPARPPVVASSAAPGAVPPPPRRRRAGGAAGDGAPGAPAPVVAPVAATAAAVGGAAAATAQPAPAAARRMVSSAAPVPTPTAVIPSVPADAADAAAPAEGVRAARPRRSRAAAGRDQLPVALRILIWVIALPVGLALVGIPARKAGYLSSQKLLDVVIKHNLDRFVPLAVIVLLWALATAILVHLLAEGGRWYMNRRRAERAAAAASTVVSSSPDAAPPPRRGDAGNAGNGNGRVQRSRAGSREGS